MQLLSLAVRRRFQAKLSACKRLGKAVQKHFEQRPTQDRKLDAAEQARRKRGAAMIAKEIKRFWAKIAKVVELKQKAQLEVYQTAAREEHLDRIVQTTEHFSTMLAARLADVQEADTVQGRAARARRVAASDRTSDAEEKDDDDDDDGDGDDGDNASSRWGGSRRAGTASVTSSAPDVGSLPDADAGDDEWRPRPRPRRRTPTTVSATSSTAGDADADADAEEEVDDDDEEQDDETTLLEDEAALAAAGDDADAEARALEDESMMPLEELIKRYQLPASVLDAVPRTKRQGPRRAAADTAPPPPSADAPPPAPPAAGAPAEPAVTLPAVTRSGRAVKPPRAAAPAPPTTATANGAGDAAPVGPAAKRARTSPHESDSGSDAEVEEQEDDETTLIEAEAEAQAQAQASEAEQAEQAMELDALAQEAALPLEQLLARYFESQDTVKQVVRRSADALRARCAGAPDAPAAEPPATQPSEATTSSAAEVTTESAAGSADSAADNSSAEGDSSADDDDSSAEDEATNSADSSAEDEAEAQSTVSLADLVGSSDDGDDGSSSVVSKATTAAAVAAMDGDAAAESSLARAARAGAEIQPTGFTLATTNVTTRVPHLLRATLREYQIVGLQWLVTMYERGLNGVLADEMGLGKTMQTIGTRATSATCTSRLGDHVLTGSAVLLLSFFVCTCAAALFAYLAVEKHCWGPHLVVVPTSVMINWELEFKRWCPAFKLLVYYGNSAERRAKRQGWSKEDAFHVCITSYTLIMQDQAIFRRKRWEYLVLDEAQNIKNFRSQRWQTLLHFKSRRRLLLTGTPLQNSLMELWSLLVRAVARCAPVAACGGPHADRSPRVSPFSCVHQHFLMPKIFESHKDFQEWFSRPVHNMVEGMRRRRARRGRACPRAPPSPLRPALAPRVPGPPRHRGGQPGAGAAAPHGAAAVPFAPPQARRRAAAAVQVRAHRHVPHVQAPAVPVRRVHVARRHARDAGVGQRPVDPQLPHAAAQGVRAPGPV